jgi:hypothetical protein
MTQKLLVSCVLAALLGLSACDKAEDKPASNAPTTPGGLPADAANIGPGNDEDAAERARLRRPPPASIGGYNNDGNNPNGMPGPSSGTSTSPNRF